MLGDLPSGQRVTLGADRGYDTKDFVEGCRELAVTPHVAQNTTNRSSRIDGRKTRHRGWRKVGWVFPFTAAAYNLVRIRNLALAA